MPLQAWVGCKPGAKPALIRSTSSHQALKLLPPNASPHAAPRVRGGKSTEDGGRRATGSCLLRASYLPPFCSLVARWLVAEGSEHSKVVAAHWDARVGSGYGWARGKRRRRRSEQKDTEGRWVGVVVWQQLSWGRCALAVRQCGGAEVGARRIAQHVDAQLQHTGKRDEGD